MDILIILTYAAICITVFKVFKIPLNKLTVPTAALGGVIIVGALVLTMNYNHPYSNMAREFFVTTPIVPAVSGIVTSVEVEPNMLVEKGTVFTREKPIQWKCSKCGFVHESTEPPGKCPACKHPKEYFEPASMSFGQ